MALDTVAFANALWGTTIASRQTIDMDEEVAQTLDGMHFAMPDGSRWRMMMLERVDTNGHVWYRECGVRVSYIDLSCPLVRVTHFCLDERVEPGELLRSYLVLPLTDPEGNIELSKVKVRGRVRGTDWVITKPDAVHRVMVSLH